jgi:UDP-2,4-diacetamido-2,4,6-trideoxy-beta-L-altropyranose hydrolase
MISEVQNKTGKILIRIDASVQIGTGHVMRCIPLAQAWQDRGVDVTFLGHCDSESLHQLIIDEGFDFIPIEKPHPDPYDLNRTLEILKQLKTQNSKLITWLALDGYHFTPDYQKAIRENGYRLLVIDDMAHLDHYHADILLNQNVHASSLHYSCDRDTVKLLGCEYVLLRREFLKYKDWKREIHNKAKNILVTMGGADSKNVTLKVIKALKLLNDPDLEFKVVVGPNNPHVDTLKNAIHNAPPAPLNRAPLLGIQPGCSMRLVLNATNMSELMAWADVAVSAGGATCWEMAFMGLPNAILVLAENQRKNAESLASAGIALNLGWYEEINELGLTETLNVLMSDQICRKEMSAKGRKLVDGAGTHRALSHMLAQPIQLTGDLRLRRGSIQDAELLWRWANDPGVRKNSLHPETIPLSEHVEWLHGKIASSGTRIWILELNQLPVAQIRYDRVHNNTAEIDFSVAPEYRHRGLGTMVLVLTYYIACRELGVKRLRGLVVSSNKASAYAFAKAGFENIGQEEVSHKHCDIFVWEYSGGV